MTYATYGDDPDFAAEYEEPVDETRRDLDDLFHLVEGLRYAVEEADARDQGLRRELTDLNEKVERHTGGVRRYESRMDLVTRQIERVQQQLQALERAVRLSDGIPVVDLDAVGPETRELATEAARWDTLEKQLVPKQQRARYEEQLERHTQLRLALTSCDADLIRTITTLAKTGRGSSARGDADAELTMLTRRRRTLLDEEIPTAATVAEAAKHALDEADVIEAKILPQLERAERAWADLQTRLRTSITDAIGSSALLPVWFSHAFGVAPPPGAAGDEWIRVAASVLAYRVSYGVDDQALPLGPAPGKDADPAERRWSWRALLETQLDDLALG